MDTEVNIMLSGAVSDSWTKGENHQIVPTETQKNTCYAIAAKVMDRLQMSTRSKIL